MSSITPPANAPDKPPRPPVSTVGDPVFTASDVARALGVSVESVRKWELAGALPFTARRVRLPGVVDEVRVFSAEDVDALRVWFIEHEQTRGPGGRPPHCLSRKRGKEDAPA